MALRICITATCLRERNHKWRLSIKKSVPCSFGVIARVILRFTDDFDVCNIQLITKFRTFVFFDNPCYKDWRFLAQAFDGIKFSVPLLPKFFNKFGLKIHLGKGSPVTQLQESNFPLPDLLATKHRWSLLDQHSLYFDDSNPFCHHSSSFR